ncbi:uncharacterized protein LOC129002546 [Macrosteles quadrilineatus]|uniref:uncharacterized protein LOC129002546 n=1 Tax=Macrosteles quadrilineatus TaxID=74068 RepID=UPI0023E1AB3E|nr:uncharacterized protein LOC129002546 [Macrosteles quadrilineatus]
MSLRQLNLKKVQFLIAKNEVALFRKCATNSKFSYSTDAVVVGTHSTDSNYPPILDPSPSEVYKRERDAKLDKMKRLGTVEEKLIGINMPRYYGWSSIVLQEGNYPFNFMPFVQHITRTDFQTTEIFPFPQSHDESHVKNVIKIIRPQLQDALLMELSKIRHLFEYDGSKEKMGDSEISNEITKGVVEQINRVLTANLASGAPHLYHTEVDFEPRIEAFWRVGGFYPDNETYKKRVKDKEDYEKELEKNRHAKRKNEEDPDDLVGHFIQYIGTPVLQLRHPQPLRLLEWQSSETANSEFDLQHVPSLRYDPGFYGLEKIRRHGTNIPGFWPGDPCEFGLLSFHNRGHLLGRPPSFGEEDVDHTVHAQAMLAGYSWMLAQAAYQGFSTFHDITYPLTTTTVVTDGRVFSFYASQLNTLLLHDEFIDINPKVNVCCSLPTCELYERIDGNEFVGWNDQALEYLVQAYLNKPEAREGVDMKPYVDKDVPLVKDISHEERREWLHGRFRHLYSNRPRHRLAPEMYDWEEIYKVKFDARPFDAKRRFFEIDVDPFKRRLDDHSKPYIPRKFRDPENYKKKFYDTFYPDC